MLVVTKSGSKVMNIENQMKKRFLYILQPSCGFIRVRIFLCITDHIHSTFFPHSFACGFHASERGFLFFFLLVFIAPVWVSYQSCSFAFSTDKDEKCLPLSFSYKMPTASLNHASVLLGLFSPLTHFNTYQLQGLVLPKLLRMKTKIPLS